MRRISKILYTLIMTALIVVILAAALIPRVLGLVPLTLVSGSMEGKYSTGDLLVVNPLEDAEKETLHVGDVVSFYPTPNDISNLTSHRIIDVTTTGDDILYTTKGDATDSADKPIKPVQVAGKVLYHVPFAGYAVQATDDLDRTLVSQVIGVGLIAFAAFSTCSAFFRRKKGGAEVDTDAPDAEVNAMSPSE
ncbi:signal peptidase I [Paeniglutamicibacter sp.]|uniref:signal peptidase I n=1 Tax=Paeniglutamicibacter sp. TaxID=1934391 RepID=UPI003989DEA6